MPQSALKPNQPEFSLTDWLVRYTPFDALETLQVKQLEQFLSMSGNPYARDNLVAHIVADAWIMNQDLAKVLLMHHAYKGAWFSPGGHCDGNPDVLATATREIDEETGLTDIRLLSDNLFDVNCGYVPYREKPHGAEPLHLHFDICFLFQADDQAPLTLSDEGSELRWVPVSELPSINIFHEHRRRITKTLAAFPSPLHGREIKTVTPA